MRWRCGQSSKQQRGVVLDGGECRVDEETLGAGNWKRGASGVYVW